MGTTLTGQKIKDTYKSLIKVSDNSEASSTAKELSDGNGNDFGVYIDTDGVLGVGSAASYSLDISSKTDGVALPVGTTVNRPTGAAGVIRYNSTIGKVEFYDTGWKTIFTTSGGTISGDVIITGDLTVQGDNTIIEAQTIEVEDNILNLNRTQGSPDTATATTSGISVYRGDGVTEASFIFDDADDTWDLTNNLVVAGNFTASSIIKSGGTSNQFLKADGSIDTNSYLTTESDTLDSVTDRGNTTTNSITVNTLTGTISGTSVLADGVTATTQTQGDNSTKIATTAYVDAAVTAEDLDFAGGTGTGSVDLDSQTFTIAGTANEIETSASGQTLTIGLPNDVTITGDLTVDTNTLYVDSTNNRVGIGTASPSSTLTVRKDGSSTLNEVIRLENLGAGNNEGSEISWYSNDGKTANISSQNSTNSYGNLILDTFDNDHSTVAARINLGGTFDGISDTPFIALSTSNTERMRIHSGGDISFRDTSANEAFYWDASAARLGIGTGSAPSASLEVSSQAGTNVYDAELSVIDTRPLAANTGGGIKFGGVYTSTGTINPDFGFIRVLKDNATSGNYSYSMAFGTRKNGQSPAERMRITSAGSIEIPNQNAINEIQFTGSEYTNIYSQTTSGFDIGTNSTSGTSYLNLLTEGAERVRIDSSGRVGISATPSTWFSVYKPLQLGSYGATITGQSNDERVGIWSNIYADASNVARYVNNGAGSILFMNDGGLTFEGFGVGTTDATATGTPYFKIDSSGNVGIGNTSPDAKLSINVPYSGSGSIPLNLFRPSSDNTGYNGGIHFSQYNSAAEKITYAVINQQINDNTDGSEDGSLTFSTIGNGTRSIRMVIDSSGVVSVRDSYSPTFVLQNTDTSVLTNQPVGEIRFTTDDASPTGANVGNIKLIANNNFSTNSTATSMAFSTCDSTSQSATERMRITSGGEIQVGTAGFSSGQPTNKGKIRLAKASEFGSNIEFISTDFGSGYGWSIGSHDQSGGVIDLNFYSRSNTAGWGKKFLIEANGNVKSATGSYGTISSDERLKENILDASPKLQDILSLNVKNYNYIGEESKQIGFIAQEFEQVFPSLVTERDTRKYDEDGNLISGFEDTKGLKVGMEFAILVKAMQEQQEIINDLKARIETLENQ